MTAPADLVVRGDVHGPDSRSGAVAVRNGRVVRRCDAYEAQFLTGVETTVLDADGYTVVPGFVDARVKPADTVDADQARAHRAGVTAVHVAVGPERAAAFRTAAAADDLTLDVRLQHPAAARTALADAGLRTNHGDTVTVGALVFDADAHQIRERAMRAAEAGFQVAIEVPDRDAADRAVSVLSDCRPRRHRIEGAVPHEAALDTFEGVVVADGDAEGLSAPLDSSATLALAGDAPLETIADAVDAGLPAKQAIDAHTRGAAFAGFGKASTCADFAVVSGDPFESPADATVVATISGGELVYDAR